MSTKFRNRVVTLLSVMAASVVLGVTSAQAAPAASSESLSGTSQDLVAQDAIPDVEPGRATRSGPSYIGVGGNVGFGGDTALGDSAFTVYSKIGLTRNFSARPGVVIGANDPTILLPVTVDLPIAPVSRGVDFAVAPFVGGGVAVSTGSDSVVRPMAVGGVDVPISNRFTATAQGNVAFFQDVEGSVILGVGYNF